jgi:hypothetical protein
MFMTEPDPFDSLLREWKAPEPSPQLDTRVADAYRASFPDTKRSPTLWRFWKARVSIPVPVLLAATIVIVLLAWYRSSSSSSPSTGPLEAAGVVTRVSATGFEPLLNGEARIIPAKETAR